MRKKMYLRPEIETVTLKGEALLHETSYTPNAIDNFGIKTTGFGGEGNHDNDYGNDESAKSMNSGWSIWGD